MMIYIAVDKKTGKIKSGASGQYAFADRATLKRSMGQTYSFYKWQAEQKGEKFNIQDQYIIHELDVSALSEYSGSMHFVAEPQGGIK